MSNAVNKYNKRKITKPSVAEKIIRYKNILGIGVLALAASFGITNLSRQNVTVGIVADLPDDNFIDNVPLYSDKSTSFTTALLPDNTLIISTEEIMENDVKMYKVSAINRNNVKVSGYLPSKYIKVSAEIDSFSSLYRVNTSNGVNLRSTPEVSENNKITVIPNGTVVVCNGSNNDWSKITHITKNSIQSGYSQSKYLQPLNPLSKCESLKQKCVRIIS